MRKFMLIMCVAAIISGCATIASPASGNSSLVIGKLDVEVSGMGVAHNQSSGWVRTDNPSSAALWIRNEATGKLYEIRTQKPGDLFMLVNVEPGSYRLVELWAQVRAEDAYVTITSDFTTDVEFEVKPGSVVNFGVNRWKFFYDLTQETSTNTFAFNNDFPSVENAFHRFDPHARWLGRKIEATSFSGKVSARPSAEALPPIMLPFG
jgi:uncharacterized protein YceK